MEFFALTGAPYLDCGVILNIMAIPQRDGSAPPVIDAGANVTIRFGHCCPDMAEAEIVSRTAGRAVLILTSQWDAAEAESKRDVQDPKGWVLEPAPGKSGVSVAGIVSENWVVLGATAPGTKDCKAEDRALGLH